jgi:EAL domain-containing protein (putative c-di-GMP-specific phosphodiesterase class I)
MAPTPVVAPRPPPLPTNADPGARKPPERRRGQAPTPTPEADEVRSAPVRSRSSLQWLAGSPARDRAHPAHRSTPTVEPPPADARARTSSKTERGPLSARARTTPGGDARPRVPRPDVDGRPREPKTSEPPARSRRSAPSSNRRGESQDSLLEQAIGARQIEVVFQPVVDLKSGTVFAYEALARSKSPYFVDPTVLFSEALRVDRCGELGRLLRGLAVEACPDAPLFLNVHPSELNDRYLVRPDDPLYAHPHSVFLEVTESVPISHYEFCHTVLREIRSRGVFLVVDDLGAGYSNLMYIVDLYPEVVKLDRKLVTGLHQKPRQQMLVRHIVELCSGLGARVVAEGIETLDELHAVRDQGVRYVQGFLLARPSNPPPPIALTRRELG